MNKQEINDNSIGIQAEKVEITNGITTREEIIDICKAVFFDNFMKLRDESKLIVDSRLQEFCNAFFVKSSQLGLLNTSKFANPDIQYILYEAQKAYVRTDDKSKHDLIIDLISNRLNSKENTNKQLNINEAITMISKLNSTHINILTLIQVITYTNSGILSNSQLPRDSEIVKNYIENFIMPFVPNTITKTDIEYMSYCGCGTSLLGDTFQEKLVKEYPSLFKNIKKGSNHKIDVLINDSYEDLEEYIISLNSDFKRIFEIFNGQYLCAFNLTSVSKLIAIYNYNRVTPGNMCIDLWIK